MLKPHAGNRLSCFFKLTRNKWTAALDGVKEKKWLCVKHGFAPKTVAPKKIEKVILPRALPLRQESVGLFASRFLRRSNEPCNKSRKKSGRTNRIKSIERALFCSSGVTTPTFNKMARGVLRDFTERILIGVYSNLEFAKREVFAAKKLNGCTWRQVAKN